MSVLDIIIGCFLIAGVFSGFRNGLIEQVGALISLVVAFIVARPLSVTTASFFNRLIEIPEQILPPLSILVTFFIVFFVCYLITIVVKKIVHILALGLVDRVLGTLLGIVKAVLILGFVFLVIEKADTERSLLTKERIENTYLYQPIRYLSNSFYSMISWEDYFDEVKSEINRIVKQKD